MNDFRIDERDYAILCEVFLPFELTDEEIQSHLQQSAHIRPGDEARRVFKLCINYPSPKIQSLPSSFGKLDALKSLAITSAEFSTFPEAIFELENLERLTITYDQFTALPSSIGKLKNLEFLNLNCTYITSLPDEIGDLVNLEELILSTSRYYCSLRELSPSVGRLKQLKELDLSFLKISDLPEEIGSLANLKVLTLSHTSIRKLPISIGKLTNLEHLDLKNTHYLHDLQRGISHLTNLRQLNLDGACIFSFRNRGLGHYDASYTGGGNCYHNASHIKLHHKEIAEMKLINLDHVDEQFRFLWRVTSNSPLLISLGMDMDRAIKAIATEKLIPHVVTHPTRMYALTYNTLAVTHATKLYSALRYNKFFPLLRRASRNRWPSLLESVDADPDFVYNLLVAERESLVEHILNAKIPKT